ncbi:MAG TPA: hypothetical protein VI451_17445 [Anaerolineales bacterium]|jgi:hypothetical protein|nr:hypothetical protein [Anaerolineales bacterium]
MLNTVWAVVREGKIVPVEKIKLPENARVLVTFLPEEETEHKVAAAHSARPFGLAAGEFIVPDDFDAPLPEDVLKEFEGA